MPATTIDDLYVSLMAARERMGVGPVALKAMISAGLITVRRLPGARPKVRLADVEALIAANTRPAKAIECR